MSISAYFGWSIAERYNFQSPGSIREYLLYIFGFNLFTLSYREMVQYTIWTLYQLKQFEYNHNNMT